MAQKRKLILLEDEEEIVTLVKLQAEIAGYKLQVEGDGMNGYRAIEREKPDLVLLDLTLPGRNGLEVCRKMKSSSELKAIPVVMLSATNEEPEIILGFDLGADDYVFKPFSPKVLFSRIKAILRRVKEPEKAAKPIRFSDFTLEIDRYMLRKVDKMIPLTLSEFGILKRLAMSRGKVLTRNQLLEDINNDDALVVDRNIDVHIASLRKKLGPSFEGIETVRGVGYRFREE